MTIAINPTTTIAQLTQNNTSAADSFPGWVNGIAKAANVSHEPLGIPQMKLVHRCDWWGASNHPNIGVTSWDPVYCAKTAADMKVRGLDGCLLDWYGQGHNTDKSLLVLRPELENQGLKFALCVDGGMATIEAATTDAARTTALLNALAYARKTYFNSPAYLKDGGKFVLLFFGFATGDFDWAKIRTVLADCKLIFRWEYRPKQYSNRSYADGYFGWTDNCEEWITNVKAKAPGKLIFLGINAYFDNTVENLPVLCKWGVGKEKVIESNGGVRFQDQLTLAAAHPEIPYTSINTLNDYQEGSALEPGIASGFALTASLQGNTLQWNQPTAAFVSVVIYISLDGQNLMRLAEVPVGGNKLDLGQFDIPLGKYYFVSYAKGKAMIQNVVGSPVIATIGWTA